MKGYDFDKTIYKGDSTTDFFFYMIFSRPYLLIFAPWFLIVMALYGMRIIQKKKLKELLFFFIPWYSNISKIVDKFWERNANKIQDWYCLQRETDDVVISASLGFIIKPAVDMLNVKHMIASNYNVKTGKIVGENCYGKVKQDEFKRMFKDEKLEAFYSDSMSDLPMFEVSKKSYLVKNNKIIEVDLKNLK